MKPIYEFNNYKSYFNALILLSENNKQNVYDELSCSIDLSIRKLSKVLGGVKHFTEDRLSLACIYFGLGDLETKYVMVLLQLNQAVSWQEIDQHCGTLETLKHEIIDQRVEQTTGVVPMPDWECA